MRGILFFGTLMVFAAVLVHADETITYSVYQTRKGDTLKSLAGRRDFYGDSLKWPLLYILNRDELNAKSLEAEKLPDVPLSVGMMLAYVKVQEAEKKKDTLLREGKNWWVVNVISSTNMREIQPLAIKLMNNGHFVYIVEWLYKKKSWKRLRLGFFKDQEEATQKGNEVLKILGLKSFWTVEAPWKEINEYLGFAGCFASP